jgi:hypothetical protein
VDLGCRGLAPVALAGLLVLAGCGGLGAGGDDSGPEATLTPVDVPGDSGSAGPAVEALPPGVTPAGVEDPFALAWAHTGALEGRSYTVRSVVTVRHPNGTLRGRRRTVARVGADRRRFHVVHVTRGPTPPFRPVRRGAVRTPGRSVFWSDGRRLLWSVTRPNGTAYRSVPAGEYDPDGSRVGERWRGPADTGGEDIYLVLNAVRTAVSETTVAGSGSDSATGNGTAVRIESTGRASAGSVEEAHSIGAAFEYPLGAEFDTVSSVDLSATVTPDGFVREYRFAYAVGDEDERVGVVRRVTYSAVGRTAIARPAWYDRAVEEGTDGGAGAIDAAVRRGAVRSAHRD